MDIVCLGALIIDMFPAELNRKLIEVSAFRPVPGGAPANVAVAAARLGFKSAFIGKVGDDAFGRYLAKVLKQEGVNVDGIRFDKEARTTMNFHAKPDKNTVEYLFYRNPGADTRLSKDELDSDLLQNTQVLHFDSLCLTDEPSHSAIFEAIQQAHSGGALVSFDVNYRPILWRKSKEATDLFMEIIPQVDLLKANEDELALLTDSTNLDNASKLLAMGPKLCVVTLGAKGSYIRTVECGEFVKSPEVETIDAIGCGDAFIAGLLTQLIAGGDWRKNLSLPYLNKSLNYANTVGALTAQKHGVIPALPFAAEVNEFITTLNK